MAFKRPRMDGYDYPNQDVSINFIQEVKYFFLHEVCNIEKNVRKVIKMKDEEIGEKKIAFSAVAREISKLQEENVWKNNQLEDCYQAVMEKDKEIKTIKEMNKEQENRFERYEKNIDEMTENYMKMLKEKQIDNDLVKSDNVNILFENKRHSEEIDALKKVVNDKSDEMMLINVFLERKTSEMAQENEIKFALKKSIVEANNDLKKMKDEHEDIVAQFKQEKEESQLSHNEKQNMINTLSTNLETLTQESIKNQNYIDGLAVKLEIQSENIENDKTLTEEVNTLNHVLTETEYERDENIQKAKHFEQMVKIQVTEKLEITKLYKELLWTQKEVKIEMLSISTALKDQNKEQEDKIAKYEKNIDEITENHMEILNKKQIDNDTINNYNATIIFENDRQLEQIEALKKVIDEKSEEMLLIKAFLEKKIPEYEDFVAQLKIEKEDSKLSLNEKQNMIEKLSETVETLTQECITKQNDIDGLAIKLKKRPGKIENDKILTEEMDTLKHLLRAAENERNENIQRAEKCDQMLKVQVKERLETTKLHKEILRTKKNNISNFLIKSNAYGQLLSGHKLTITQLEEENNQLKESKKILINIEKEMSIKLEAYQKEDKQLEIRMNLSEESKGVPENKMVEQINILFNGIDAAHGTETSKNQKLEKEADSGKNTMVIKKDKEISTWVLLSHPLNDQKAVICPSCPSPVSLSNICKHMENVHKQTIVTFHLPCDICKQRVALWGLKGLQFHFNYRCKPNQTTGKKYRKYFVRSLIK